MSDRRGPSGPDRAHRVTPVVPAYALTRGRTRSAGADLPLEAMVMVTDAGIDALPLLQFEQRAIVRLCRHAMSVAEIAVHLRVPLGVARVLVSDLTAADHLVIHTGDDGDGPSVKTLERLLSGLRSR